MNTIPRRAFAVFWWLLHTVAFGIAGVASLQVSGGDAPIVFLLVSLIPVGTLVIIRWVLTGRWRFGPRW